MALFSPPLPCGSSFQEKVRFGGSVAFKFVIFATLHLFNRFYLKDLKNVFDDTAAFVVFTEEEPKCIGSAPCIRFDRCPGISGPDLIENLTQNQCGFDGSIPLVSCHGICAYVASSP